MSQQEFVGAGKVGELKNVLANMAPSKALLFTGKGSYLASGSAAKIEPLLKGIEIVKYNDFSANPDLVDINRSYERLKNGRFDLVIAVGGGSVIDFAKVINAVTAQAEGEPRDYITGKKLLQQKGKALIAIPTTSGSGSEATSFAVVYVDKKKYSLDHPYILPDIAIVDPLLTMAMSKNVAASSGMDALSQAIESYWAVKSTDESKGYAREAIPLIIKNIVDSVNKPTVDNRTAMAVGAHLAGKAINISRTTAPHAVSYPLTAYFGVSHGQAVGITLPEFLGFNYYVSEEDIQGNLGVEQVKNDIVELVSMLNASSIKEAKKKLLAIIRQIGLKDCLSDLGITGEKIDLIIEAADVSRMRNNPREVKPRDVSSILAEVFCERTIGATSD